MLRAQFGKRLKQLRVLKGLTQEELAEAVGVSTDFISLVERGKRAPSFENLERLAEGLEVGYKKASRSLACSTAASYKESRSA